MALILLIVLFFKQKTAYEFCSSDWSSERVLFRSPALVAVPLLFFTRKRFPLTPLVYVLVLAHCCVLFVGAHYTYAEVPLFDTIAHWMGSERNNYDKLGHFAQGFIPDRKSVV